jgi:hypothetical protein
VFEDELGKVRKRDAVIATQARVEPVRQLQKVPEWRIAQDQRQGRAEVATVADQVPVAREAPQALHGREVDPPRAEHLVGRVGRVDHDPLAVVPHDRRAAEALEHADLDLLGPEPDQAVEPRAEGVHVFARQTDDEVGVDVYAGLGAEPSEVLLHFGVVLPAADQVGDVLVERLHADFELKRAGRESFDDFPQRVGQSVGDHLEVQEQAGAVALQEEFQNGLGNVEVQVEGAVDELELAEAAIQKRLHGGEEVVDRHVPHRHVERRQAELALERAAPRGLDVDDAVGEVVVGVEVVGQFQIRRFEI